MLKLLQNLTINFIYVIIKLSKRGLNDAIRGDEIMAEYFKRFDDPILANRMEEIENIQCAFIWNVLGEDLTRQADAWHHIQAGVRKVETPIVILRSELSWLIGKYAEIFQGDKNFEQQSLEKAIVNTFMYGDKNFIHSILKRIYEKATGKVFPEQVNDVLKKDIIKPINNYVNLIIDTPVFETKKIMGVKLPLSRHQKSQQNYVRKELLRLEEKIDSFAQNCKQNFRDLKSYYIFQANEHGRNYDDDFERAKTIMEENFNRNNSSANVSRKKVESAAGEIVSSEPTTSTYQNEKVETIASAELNGPDTLNNRGTSQKFVRNNGEIEELEILYDSNINIAKKPSIREIREVKFKSAYEKTINLVEKGTGKLTNKDIWESRKSKRYIATRVYVANTVKFSEEMYGELYEYLLEEKNPKVINAYLSRSDKVLNKISKALLEDVIDKNKAFAMGYKKFNKAILRNAKMELRR